MNEANQRCAGGIVLGDNGTIALIRNQKGHQWLFPKGRLDDGEDDESAARREITEETGLTELEFIDDLGSYVRPRIREDGSYDMRTIKSIHMYLFTAPPHASLQPTMEIEEARWVALPRIITELGDAKDRAWFTTVFERVRQAVQRD